MRCGEDRHNAEGHRPLRYLELTARLGAHSAADRGVFAGLWLAASDSFFCFLALGSLGVRVSILVTFPTSYRSTSGEVGKVPPESCPGNQDIRPCFQDVRGYV